MRNIENLFMGGDFSKETGFKETLGTRLFGKSAMARKLTEEEVRQINAACGRFVPSKSTHH